MILFRGLKHYVNKQTHIIPFEELGFDAELNFFDAVAAMTKLNLELGEKQEWYALDNDCRIPSDNAQFETLWQPKSLPRA